MSRKSVQSLAPHGGTDETFSTRTKPIGSWPDQAPNPFHVFSFCTNTFDPSRRTLHLFQKKAVMKIVSPAMIHKPEVGGALYDLLAKSIESRLRARGLRSLEIRKPAYLDAFL